MVPAAPVCALSGAKVFTAAAETLVGSNAVLLPLFAVGSPPPEIEAALVTDGTAGEPTATVTVMGLALAAPAAMEALLVHVTTCATAAHVQASDTDTYGYLWWRRDFTAGGRTFPAFYMSGNGGNKVGFIPELDVAFAITSNNYNAKGMHEQTERVLVQSILAAVRP